MPETQGIHKVGHSLDEGISSFMKDLGGSVRATCPKCHGVMTALPNIYVQCPHCSHEFTSPTATERGTEIGKGLTQETHKAFGA